MAYLGQSPKLYPNKLLEKTVKAIKVSNFNLAGGGTDTGWNNSVLVKTNAGPLALTGVYSAGDKSYLITDLINSGLSEIEVSTPHSTNRRASSGSLTVQT